MTQTSIAAEMDATTAYSAYGYRQDEFGYLSETSQAQVIEHAHTVANLMNAGYDMAPHTVCADGHVITNGEVWAEIRATRAPRVASVAPMTATDPMYTCGRRWVAEIQQCPRCGQDAAAHA